MDIIMNERMQRILDSLSGVKKTGGGHMARCPAHDDTNPSLSIKQADDGRILLKCFAGCSIDAVCAGIEIDKKDLFPPSGKARPARRIVKVYDYKDEEGGLLFQKLRFEPKDFRCRVPDGSGGWIWKLDSVRRVLYNLPSVINSDTVFVCEGEKDSNLLIRHGYTATCNYEGAGEQGDKWKPEYNQYLKDKLIYVIVDNDNAGRKHALNIYNNLKDICEAIYLIELPNLPEKGDVSNFFASGGSKEQFEEIIQSAACGLPENFASLNNIESDDQVITLEEYEEEWGQAIPLDEFDLPSFPLAGSPASFSQIVREVSESHQTPFDMAALLLLTVVSSCLAGKVRIVTNNDYTELVALYTSIFAASGTRKSSVYMAFIKPLIDYQKQLRAQMKFEIESNKNEYELLKKRIESIKKELAKGKVKEESKLRKELCEKESQLADFDKPTELPLLFIETDFTIESLAPKIKSNSGVLSLFDHEGAFWNEVAGRYTQGQTQTNDLLLKGYDGSPVMVSRVMRGDIFIDSCCLAIGLIVQPTKIEELKNKKDLDETGLIPRFILSVPKDTVGYRKMQTVAVSHYAYNQYNAAICNLLKIRDGQDIRLEMTDKAHAKYVTYCESIEKRLREASDLYTIRAWANKLSGRIARIATVLHCYCNAGNMIDGNSKVGCEIVDYALSLSDYLIAHAKAAYQILHLSDAAKKAKKILRSLERYYQSSKCLQISKGALWNRVKNSDKSMNVVASISKALDILEDHNLIKPACPEKKRGRPAETYLLNPEYFTD